MLDRVLGQADVEREFNLDEAVDFPSGIELLHVDGMALALVPEMARWAVLDSGAQLQIFQALAAGETPSVALQDATSTWGESKAELALGRLLVELTDKEFWSHAPVRDKASFADLKVNLTEACNLRCVHCYRSSGLPLGHELTAEEWTRVVRQHATLGGESITVAGGEPMFRPEKLLAVLRAAKEGALKTVMLTNGVLLTPDTLHGLEGLLDQVQISIDGPNRMSNDLVRGRGTFERILRAIRLLGNSDMRVIIAMTPIPQTIDAYESDLGQFVDTLAELLGSRLVIKLSGIVLDGREIEGLRGAEAKAWTLRVRHLQEEVFGKGLDAKLDAASYEPGVRINGCGYGESLCVEADGRVLACDLDVSSQVGTVKDQRIAELRFAMEKVAGRMSVDSSPVCHACPLRYLCGGTCRIENRQTHGAGNELLPTCDASLKLSLMRRLVALNAFRYDSVDFELA